MRHFKLSRLFVILSAISLLGVGCGKKKDEGAGDQSTTEPSGGAAASNGPSAAVAKAKAKQIFKQRCVVCHGANGMGDGPGAATLNPKPQNYTDPAWQAKVTDDELKKAITHGGAAVGCSPLMVPNPDLAKPDQAPVLDALVKIIRGFKGKGGAAPAAPAGGAAAPAGGAAAPAGGAAAPAGGAAAPAGGAAPADKGAAPVRQ